VRVADTIYAELEIVRKPFGELLGALDLFD
jgi:hypothetical protein